MSDGVASSAPAHTEHELGLQHQFADMRQQKEASTLGMWVFIAQEILFFGGLFATYVIYRHAYPEAFALGSEHLNRTIGTVNTLVLIASSLTMAMGVYSAALGRRKHVVGFLLATVFLGTVFLGVKYYEWGEKIRPCLGDQEHTGCLLPGERFDPNTVHARGAVGDQVQIFFSLYFGMTGLHALHMIVGIPIVLTIAAMSWRGRYTPAYHTPVEIVGLYWHFVDIIWIFLFPLLYLIGHY